VREPTVAEWNVVAKARNDFADMLEDLTTEQLASQSLCEEWSVVDVAGHLVSLVELSPAKIVLGFLKNRDNPDGFISEKAKECSAWGAPALVDSLRANAGKRMKPYSEASMVNDTAVHTLDVRRPLELDGSLEPEVLRMSLDFSTSEFEKNHGAPVRFIATDSDWSWGAGPEVRGPGETLLMALNQRDVSSELEGEGVGELP